MQKKLEYKNAMENDLKLKTQLREMDKQLNERGKVDDVKLMDMNARLEMARE